MSIKLNRSLKRTLEKALSLVQKGDTDAARKLCQKVLRQDPENAHAHGLLGIVEASAKNPEKAVECFRRAIAHGAASYSNYNNLGLVLYNLGETKEAMEAMQKAKALNPNDMQLYSNIGDIYRQQRELEYARDNYLQGLRLAPENASFHFQLADILWELGQIESARKHLSQAMNLTPGDASVLAGFADFYEHVNELEKAQEIVSQGLKLDAGHPINNLIAAKLERRKGNLEQGVERLKPFMHDQEYSEIHFELGQLYDAMKQPEQAFEHFSIGNSITKKTAENRQQNPELVREKYLRHIAELTDFFSNVSKQQFISTDENVSSPIFIFGFPRSGTTLLDSILGGHSQTIIMEEKPALARVKQSLVKKHGDYPKALWKLSPEDIIQLRRQYYDEAGKLSSFKSSEQSILVDKGPYHTLNLGLIYTLFPDARLILALRHPCDTCLSCFMQNFIFSPPHTSFYTLEDTVELYSRFMELWERQKRIFPLKVHVLKYEALVEEPAKEIRELVEFLNLPWEDSLLEHQKYSRETRVRTASYAQVNQPIYTHARYRWQRYQQFFEPHMAKLQPYIDLFGY